MRCSKNFLIDDNNKKLCNNKTTVHFVYDILPWKVGKKHIRIYNLNLIIICKYFSLTGLMRRIFQNLILAARLSSFGGLQRNTRLNSSSWNEEELWWLALGVPGGAILSSFRFRGVYMFPAHSETYFWILLKCTKFGLELQFSDFFWL